MKTFASISTAMSPAAISIVRVSGDQAVKIAKNITRNKFLPNQNTINLYKIYDGEEIIDFALISFFKGPNSYTGEDVVEINCHGGTYLTKKVLHLLLKMGAELATPGEFTKTAYLNGKIDEIQVEAISKMLSATTEKVAKASINQYSGSSYSKIENLRNNIMNLIASIEVNIDYPEYETEEEFTKNILIESINNISEKMNNLNASYLDGAVLSEGIDVALIGKPNVGKSSLLNKLCDTNKAIVTNIAGTTRDVIEQEMTIGGYKINLIDTAGIRKTKNEIEKIGINKTLLKKDNADLVINLTSSNYIYTDDEIKSMKNDCGIIVQNKIDENELLPFADMGISVLENTNIDKLKEKIINVIENDKLQRGEEYYFANIRQMELLKKSMENVQNIQNDIELLMPLDIISINLRELFENLGEMMGKKVDDEIIDRLFSDYCLGK